MATRYFRFTINPASTSLVAGRVTVRLRVNQASMLYASFSDGQWVAVDDTEMGAWGGPTDYLLEDLLGPAPYKLFQEGLPDVNPASVPAMAAHLQPFDASPQAPPPVVWTSPVAVGQPL